MSNNNVIIPNEAIVKMYSSPNYTQIVFSKNHSSYVPTKKLNKNSYVDIRSGEIKEYNKKESKTIDSFKKSFKKIMLYLNAYFKGDNSERHIVLTYSYFIDDLKQMSGDFKQFFKKIKLKYPSCIYLIIKEPHANGSWHIHCILKNIDGKPFNITISEVKKLWPHGEFVSVSKINNIGALCCYFDITRSTKKLNRLQYYKPNSNIFSKSRYIHIDKSTITYQDAIQSLKGKILVHRSKKTINKNIDGKDVTVNEVIYEQYIKEDSHYE